MSLRLIKLPMAILAVLCAMSALAQAPIPYGLPVSVENAKKAAATALDEARKGNWKMAVAVVDTGGTLVYYEKMDNTQIGSADIAIDKARTAVRFKRPSKAFQDVVAGGGAGRRSRAARSCSAGSATHRRRHSARHGRADCGRHRRFRRQRRS
jgi:hypothetical protein